MESKEAEQDSAELLEQILEAQTVLSKNVLATSQFLRFALELGNNNLAVVQNNLLALKSLYEAMLAENISHEEEQLYACEEDAIAH